MKRLTVIGCCALACTLASPASAQVLKRTKRSPASVLLESQPTTTQTTLTSGTPGSVTAIESIITEVGEVSNDTLTSPSPGSMTSIEALFRVLEWPVDCIPRQEGKVQIGQPLCGDIRHADQDGNDLAWDCSPNNYRGHKGIDIGAFPTTPIYAALDGVVKWTRDGYFDECGRSPTPEELKDPEKKKLFDQCLKPTEVQPAVPFVWGTDVGAERWIDVGDYVWDSTQGKVVTREISQPGNFVVIEHDYAQYGITSTAYYHMKKGTVAVRPGQRVRRGQYIGQVGSSAYSSGPHLHFEIGGRAFFEDSQDAWPSLKDANGNYCGSNRRFSRWLNDPPWKTIEKRYPPLLHLLATAPDSESSSEPQPYSEWFPPQTYSYSSILASAELESVLEQIVQTATPPSILIDHPYTVSADSANGNFYVADYNHARIVKFDTATGAPIGWIGRVLTSGGTCTAAPGSITGKWCAGGTAQGGSQGGAFNGPTDVVAVPSRNLLLVTDYHNHRVQRFDLATGAPMGWLGKIETTGGTCTAGAGRFSGGWCSGGASGPGSGDGMLKGPHGLAVDAGRGVLYVADGQNYRVQRFDLVTGKFLGWLGRIGSTGGTCTAGVGKFTGKWCSGGTGVAGIDDGQFALPVHLAVDPVNSVLLVSDYGAGRISSFDLASGSFVGWLGAIATSGGTCSGAPGTFTGGWCRGGTPGFGSGNGMLRMPHALAVDPAADMLYVADYMNHRIQRYRLRSGAFAGWTGGVGTPGGTCTAPAGSPTGKWCSGGTSAPGSTPGMVFGPVGIAVDVARGILLTSEHHISRVQRFNRSTGATSGTTAGSGGPAW